MRIGQLAEAAGTTTRTVRHYHRLGLLAEPRRLANGYREYAMGDLVRLMRIRWLASSGVPLGSVAAVLAEERSSADQRDVLADLRALLAVVESEQALLARRHARLTAMLAEAEQGQPISALPRELATALNGAVDSASSPAVGAMLRLERDLLEAAVLSGAEPEFVTGFAEMLADAESRAGYLALLSEWVELEGREPDSATTQIDALVRRMLESHRRGLVEFDMPEAAGVESGAFSLEEVVPDRAQREVVRRFLEQVSARSGTS
ncbi:MerR family transcriptional regulator [Nocardia shimofusensis]|uniref:MerR family transcriptional regulator n=1 Tax=Nocardia shimofusensis TaxID=228596 RepID=UPI0008342F9C|nr:MerR family transcriptional regulator [Nocardia shimofusensis]